MAELIERITQPGTKLYEAALVGDVPTLLNLLQEDPLLLERCNIDESARFVQSPLHVAANLGHIEFTKEIAERKPELAEELDQSRRWTPLHMASAKGYLEIVKILLAVNPSVCLVRDQDGRNPVHIAATTGQVHVLYELLNAMLQAARERTNSGDTVLHLCVKHCQTDALKYLVNALDDGELLNSRDSDGNTILHLAVASKQSEMIKFLLADRMMEINAINRNGLTATDTFIRSGKEMRNGEIWNSLKRAQGMTAKNALEPTHRERNRLEGQRNGLMIVASLIATMAFAAGINPPGGVWQDNDGHFAGTAIMADVKKGRYGSNKLLFFTDKTGIGQYNMLLIFNTVGLVSSLSVILLLISGLPCQRLFVGLLMITMWIAVTATTMTYAIAVNFLASAKPDRTVWNAIEYSLAAWIVLMVLLLLGHAVRFMIWLTKKLSVSDRTWQP